jgi:hypothetical protein
MGKADHLAKYQFKPGQRGGPGRRPGQRNWLTELALQALGDDFAIHGKSVIEKVRTEEPTNYLRIIASLMPRQLSVERVNPLDHIDDADLEAIEQLLRERHAKTVRQLQKLNGTVIDAEPVTPADERPADCKT